MLKKYLSLVLWVVSASNCNATPPHIIFIVADDLGWNDVGWHNPQMITPNLDKLARAGVIFNSSYMQPLCTPSRASFLTGYYPFHSGLQHGVFDNNKPHFLPEKYQLLPQKLKGLGYATHMIGKWHLGFCNVKYTPTYRGFDTFMGYYGGSEDYYTHSTGGHHGQQYRYDFRMNLNTYKPPQGEYSTVTYAKRAVEIITNHDPQKQPLFLYLPFQNVHIPLEVPQAYADRYSNILDSNRRKYSGMVTILDEAVGNITQALETRGFMNNALIVFTSDNGGSLDGGANNYPLRGAKGTVFEGGTRVPGFVYSSNLLQQKGYVNNALIHATDWFPTLIAAAGGSPDFGIDGINQWQTLKSNANSSRTEMIYNIDDLGQTMAIRVGDYKLIRGKHGRHSGWYPLLSNGSYQSVEPSTEHHAVLFNIKDDPNEHNDLSGQHHDILNHLQQRLHYYRNSLVPAQNPAEDAASDPQNYGGYWSPGWC